jgi:hypothetical protein
MTGSDLRRRLNQLGLSYSEAAQLLGLSLPGLNHQMRDVHPITRQTELLLERLEQQRFDLRNREMIIYDLTEIKDCQKDLEAKLKSFSIGSKKMEINPIAVKEPTTVYFFPHGLWWSPRLYPRPPKAATRVNNLFGLGQGANSDVEVNFPIVNRRGGKPLQGALVRFNTGEIVLAHRGQVQHRRRSFSVLDAMEKRGASLIRLPSNDPPLIRVCSISALKLEDIEEFVKRIIQVKAEIRGNP